MNRVTFGGALDLVQSFTGSTLGWDSEQKSQLTLFTRTKLICYDPKIISSQRVCAS